MLHWDETGVVPLLRWEAPSGVAAVFSTRAGGVSAESFASLNLGMRSGDDAELVAENRRRLLAAFGADPLHTHWCRQIHSGLVLHADQPPAGGFLAHDAVAPEGDGVMVDRPGETAVAFAADCVPVVVARSDGTAVAVAHAGWRGLVAGVVEAAVERLGPGPKAAAIGPSAGPERYEVGEEVAAQLQHRFGFGAVRRGAAIRADLWRCTEAALRASGVEAIDTAQLDTIADERFFSARRQGAVYGRQAVLARLSGLAV